MKSRRIDWVEHVARMKDMETGLDSTDSGQGSMVGSKLWVPQEAGILLTR
jgi:hypothetical protein